MTLNDDDPDEHQEPHRDDAVDHRSWRYVDPMERLRNGSTGMALEACVIGFVLIAVWVNAGIIVWRGLLD
jgi:hypothetical protein